MKEKTIQRLVDLKEEIGNAKLEKAKAEGSLKSSLQRLKEDFGVTTLEKAQLKLKKLQKDQEEIETEIELAIEKLEKSYEW